MRVNAIANQKHTRPEYTSLREPGFWEFAELCYASMGERFFRDY